MVLPHSLHERRSDRVALDAVVCVRRSGQVKYRVRVFDASPHGCRIEFVERPALDELIWVTFDGLEPLEAEVCWIDGFSGGVSFVRPMHEAVFGRLASRLAQPD